MPEVLAQQRGGRAADMHRPFLVFNACGAFLCCGDLPEAAGKDGIYQFEHCQGANGIQQQIGQVMLRGESVLFERHRDGSAIGDEAGDNIAHLAIKIEIRCQKEQ